MFRRLSGQLELAFSRARQVDAHSEEVIDVGDGAHLSEPERLELHARRLSAALSIACRETVEVILTDNRSTMISFRPQKGALVVRLHKMFAAADDRVINALSLFVRRVPSPSAGATIDQFIADHKGEIRGRAKRSGGSSLHPQGEVVSLSPVLERVSKKYFGNHIEGVRIGWGRPRRVRQSRRRRGRVSCALATYSYQERAIRVNPVLDSKRVPDFVLDWIVFHELLHHVLPVEKQGGRNQYHTSRFRRMERSFEQYDAARTWEAENLEWLLGIG